MLPYRKAHQQKPSVEIERSPITGLLFIVSCCDSFGLVLFTDAVSSLDDGVQSV